MSKVCSDTASRVGIREVKRQIRDSELLVYAIGIDGLALGFVNGLKYLPYIRDEVLPRLVRLGLRAG